ncbi:MAG: hypothetical protein EYC67_12985 [Betaproteobacteria bacterium]|nr:MAG: hypothetical protein EYC67_12985 [Betaproteobacteria bacterium]
MNAIPTRKKALWAGLIVAAAATLAALFLASNRGELPEGLIQANGRIEGNNVAIASKYPARQG